MNIVVVLQPKALIKFKITKGAEFFPQRLKFCAALNGNFRQELTKLNVGSADSLLFQS
jgi:hypothetical protein